MPSQGQPKGAGQAAGDRSVTFTRGAAQRIAKAVRIVEGGSREQGGLTFDHPMPGVGGKVFRICTFTGAWSINSSKNVTFFNVTTTPNTVAVQNVMFPLPSLSTTTSTPTVCAIAKDGTAWYLVNVIHANHNALTDVTLTPTSLQFSRRDVLTISATAATTGISVAACNTAQASPQALSYFQ